MGYSKLLPLTELKDPGKGFLNEAVYFTVTVSITALGPR